MSGKPLGITVRQARALLKAANAERGIAEVKMGGVFVRLIPEVLASNENWLHEPVAPKREGHL